MAKYKVKEKSKVQTAAKILYHLRHHTRLWEEHYGAARKNNKVRWQEIADQWLSENEEKA